MNLRFIEIDSHYYPQLLSLHKKYKFDVGEAEPDEKQITELFYAIEKKQIRFYGCLDDEKLVACCSVCHTFSTYDYGKSGIFEDFYILPEYRHSGIARQLVSFTYIESKVNSLLVSCADCDKEMYISLGFTVKLGNTLAFE